MPYLAVLMLALFFAGIAMTVNEGLWSNAVSLFCVILGGLLAWDWGRVLGRFVIDQAQPSPQYEWFFWFAAVWGVFFFSVTLLRIIADRTSRVRMRFIKPVEIAGGLLFGLGVAIMFTSFAAYTLYIPFKAGEWKVASGPGWSQQVFTTFAGPFYSAGRAVHGDNFPNLAQ